MTHGCLINIRCPNPLIEAWRVELLRRPLLFKAWRAALTAFGHTTCWWMRPLVTEDQIAWCKQILEPGDFIGVESRRYPTGWILPKGYYGVEHSAPYVGNNEVVEAVTPCSRLIPLDDFLRPYDRIVIVKPGYLYDRVAACEKARSLVGIPYDVLFQDGERMVYCHESCAVTFAAGMGHDIPRASWCYVFNDIAAAADCLYEAPRD